MKLFAVGAVLLFGAAAAALVGAIPMSTVWAIADRTWSILLFVVSITVVANLATMAGLFDVIAAALGRAARGRSAVLWIFVVVLAVLSTTFLSLDTTAVLLTPVVVGVAMAAGLRPMPFALATVWIANTASLWLPVSNLPNLLAEHRLGSIGPAGYLALLGPSALIATAVTVVALLVVDRRVLVGRFQTPPSPHVADRVLLIVTGCLVAALLPFLVSGIPPWLPATIAAAILTLVFGWRSPRSIRTRLVPWRLVVFAAGLFLAVGVAQSLGTDALLATIAGSGDDLLALWQIAGSGLLGANTINNLPAYLVLENIADTPSRLAALLIGVNAGALITPWASLATLLWHQQLRGIADPIGWGRYALLGLCAAPIIVLLAVIPLAI